MKNIHGTVAAFVVESTSQFPAAPSHTVGWGQQMFDTAWKSESFVELQAGSTHTLARRSDGTVRAWGGNFSGECEVPLLPGGVSFVELDGGGSHTLARRSDGAAQA